MVSPKILDKTSDIVVDSFNKNGQSINDGMDISNDYILSNARNNELRNINKIVDKNKCYVICAQ